MGNTRRCSLTLLFRPRTTNTTTFGLFILLIKKLFCPFLLRKQLTCPKFLKPVTKTRNIKPSTESLPIKDQTWPIGQGTTKEFECLMFKSRSTTGKLCYRTLCFKIWEIKTFRLCFFVVLNCWTRKIDSMRFNCSRTSKRSFTRFWVIAGAIIYRNRLRSASDILSFRALLPYSRLCTW